MTVRAHQPTHPIRMEVTRPRPTPPPADRRFRQALDESADALLTGAGAASAVVPGGGVVSAALRGGHAGAGAAETPGGRVGDAGLGDLHTTMRDDNLEFLRIQQQLQAENRRFSTLSNVMKARHETAKNAINNIR